MAESDPNSYGLSHPLRWVPEFVQLGKSRMAAQGKVLGAAMLVGLVAGLGAVVFSVLCNLVVYFALGYLVGYEDHGPAHEATLAIIDSRLKLPELNTPFNPWWLLVVPAVGGLISGWLVFRFAPEAEGHGTDAAIAAYHLHQGYIRPAVPPIKILASAITIGTGGSGGREGPIAQIGAGMGSMLARALKMRPAHCRILMAAGVGAGIAAIFRAPLAGALFAAEVMYRSPEFEAEVIIPASIASVVAYCTFGLFFGWDPLFLTHGDEFKQPWDLLPYLVLGVFMAFLAMIYTRTFYAIHYLFHKLPISNYFKPALGGFLSGVVGVSLFFGWYLCTGAEEKNLLNVLSFGYGILQRGFANEFSVPAGVLLAVALGKILTTSLTIGSGGSGGVFGPSMVIGGCGGAALGMFFHALWPSLAPHPATFMLLGMAGFFAAAGKVPLSTLVIVSEMTGNYFLLLPAMWVCVLAYLLSDEQSLYQNQVESRSRSPAHTGEYVRDVLSGLQVSQFLKGDSINHIVQANDALATVIQKLGESPYSALPVVDEKFRLQGVVVLEEVYIASRSPHMSRWILAADLMRAGVKPLRPAHTLDRAQELFVENDLYAMPVVDEDNKVLGIVNRSDLARIYLKYVHGPASEEPAPVAVRG